MIDKKIILDVAKQAITVIDNSLDEYIYRAAQCVSQKTGCSISICREYVIENLNTPGQERTVQFEELRGYVIDFISEIPLGEGVVSLNCSMSGKYEGIKRVAQLGLL